jgi:hypothetical protein
MPDITEALSDGGLKVLLLLGNNMLSSFADAGRVAEGLDKAEMVVCVDLFMNETARRFADVILPGTAWLEELGFKDTNTHLYLMERAIESEGEARPIYEILRSLAGSLDLADFFPWGSVEEVIDAILDHASTGHATVASLRAAGGFLPLKAPHVAYPDRKFESPSGKIEFYSSQAERLGLPPLPVHRVDKVSNYPLALSFGRTLTHFRVGSTVIPLVPLYLVLHRIRRTAYSAEPLSYSYFVARAKQLAVGCSRSSGDSSAPESKGRRASASSECWLPHPYLNRLRDRLPPEWACVRAAVWHRALFGAFRVGESYVVVPFQAIGAAPRPGISC